jgi:hypothetical protein
MSYGRDYGNRNFMDRAASTVRGWFGNRGGYDEGYRGGPGRGGYREEGGDLGGGYRDWRGGMEHGYGATNWTGRNPDWNDGYGANRGGEGYRTGGYQPRHGAWDVDWDDRTPRGGMNRGSGRMTGGMAASGPSYQQGYGRDFTARHPAFDDHDAYRGDRDRGMMGRPMDRGMADRGRMDRGMSGGMQGGMNRGWDREDGWNRGADRGRTGGGPAYGPGMQAGDADLGDEAGGTIGNYGAYGNYGLERFRSGSAGGVPTGQYWTGYGHGSGYRG